jgi:hypothetical protein
MSAQQRSQRRPVDVLANDGRALLVVNVSVYAGDSGLAKSGQPRALAREPGAKLGIGE